MYHIKKPTMAKNPTTPTTIPIIIGRLLLDSSTYGVAAGVVGVTPGVVGVPGTGVGDAGVPGVIIAGGAPGVIYLSTTP